MTDLNPEELKPCPFCGGHATLLPNKVDFAEVWGTVCTECSAWLDSCEEEPIHAILAWNTRAALSAPHSPTEAQAARPQQGYEHPTLPDGLVSSGEPTPEVVPTADVTIPGLLFMDMHTAYVAAPHSPDDSGLERYAALGRVAEKCGLAWYNEAGKIRLQPPMELIEERAVARALAAVPDSSRLVEALKPFADCYNGIEDMVRFSGGKMPSPHTVFFQGPYEYGGPSGRLEWRHMIAAAKAIDEYKEE